MKAYRRFLMSFSSFLIRPCSDRMAGEPEIQSSLALIGYLLATAICISYISKAKLPIIISKVGPDIRQCRINLAGYPVSSIYMFLFQFSSQYYNFSSFTMKLNEAGQGGKLAPTDCRNRPDIR